MAKVALARMGDQRQLDDFIVGLSSSNLAWAEDCVDYLGEIGDTRAVKHLAPFLYRHDYVPNPGGFPIPLSMRAALSLALILPNVEAEYEKSHPRYQVMNEDDWRKWWEKNKKRFKSK